jgi:uncharacterized membrane protein
VTGVLLALTAATALACAVVAGVFFAFSSFVMRALSRLRPPAGIAAMQAINAAAIPSTFFFTALATMIGCVALACWAIVESHEPFAPYLLAGAVLYVAGSMVVTAAFNLPRNDALATVDPEDRDAADHWTRYLAEWTFWNHVRMVGALAASATLIAAVVAAELG